MISYYDEAGNIRKELLNEDAEKRATEFVRVSQIKSAQLRRFYGDLKSLERKLDFKMNNENIKDPFLSVLPLVKMIKSKVAYASNPKNPKIPKTFADWLSLNIDSVNTIDDFKAFMLHFEAVVGFCYGAGLSNN